MSWKKEVDELKKREKLADNVPRIMLIKLAVQVTNKLLK